MKTLLTGGRVLLGGGFVENCPLLWENGTILAVGDACDALVADRRIDTQGLTLKGVIANGVTVCGF